MFRFTIRELVLLTLAVGLVVGWSLDHLRTAAREQHWRDSAYEFAAKLSAATGKSVAIYEPDGTESWFAIDAPH